ncbi:c-type cytochrome [Ideonella sp.]|uniref:c-type cytochrome n=1 Tax=Ideonella sp. TaxID=1929293 RepID=UPI003BB705DA
MTRANPLSIALTTLFAAGLLAALPAQATSKQDNAMVNLANASGCMTCHHIDPGAKGPDGLAPIGPAWRDVSAKYQGQAGAAKQLTATVLAGSNPYESHWKGKASGLAMPPNKVAISPTDAGKLVNWILALPPSPR